MVLIEIFPIITPREPIGNAIREGLKANVGVIPLVVHLEQDVEQPVDMVQ
jgi:hypothetical protein